MIPGRKDVVEDWTGYNEAVRARAERARRRIEASRPPAPPGPPATAPASAPKSVPAPAMDRAPVPAPARPADPPARDPIGTLVRLLLAVILLLILWLVVRAHLERTGPSRPQGEVASVPPAPPTPGETSPVVTNYTIFHRVQHDSGTAVVTGWNFRRSGDPRPESQFCYLSLPVRGSLEETLNLGTNEVRRGGPIPDTATAAGITASAWATAPDKCQWFSARARTGGSDAVPALTPFGGAP